MEFGKAVRIARKKARLTQSELAERINVHEVTLRSWERNAYEPRASDIKKLCEVLEVSEAELLNGPANQEIEIRILIRQTDEEVGKVTMDMFDGVLQDTGEIGQLRTQGMDTFERMELQLERSGIDNDLRNVRSQLARLRSVTSQLGRAERMAEIAALEQEEAEMLQRRQTLISRIGGTGSEADDPLNSLNPETVANARAAGASDDDIRAWAIRNAGN